VSFLPYIKGKKDVLKVQGVQRNTIGKGKPWAKTFYCIV
jgi:hypothetical protein